jgi:hypothetical protein
LLPVFISYFCKYNDVDLLDKYLRVMVVESDSQDKLPCMTLVQLFICQPLTVLSQMKFFKDESLDWDLEGYFRAISNTNNEIDNYTELEQLLDEYFKI